MESRGNDARMAPRPGDRTRRSITLAVIVSGVLAAASSGHAQQKEPIGPFVADVRLVSSGLPSTPGWIPAVPLDTVAPTRGWGFELGAHVNVLRARSIALGVGASWLVARAAASPPDPEGTTSTPLAIPDVSTRLTSFAPQLSLNFGHALGWSYLSAGLGRARVVSEASLAGGAAFVPRESDWVKTLNYGGGARWFLTDRVGVGFDVRWHKTGLIPATATHPGAGRASMLAAGAGLVVK